ncbi:hydantoinase/oxoprolinase family protein [Prescottella agglutinans]|uniref:N-methylhydantoinase A/oxoprolinase/acetone carboxylase beta subunit n=1 Tax=Prescottella agglutinans TaxID=1644129 RepID=A0ABT6MG56_9NOCA|nr:hydantoinase/oxoprolinase family protein [Prescottella agglutinans]MDH6283308.1 N-methylhydantoinase A/oxoprolinase/acetone carboxylase beta subunit [Prescottella agglutinans]
MESLRIGIDVGGTNTDAVLMSGSQVLASTKTTTSTDITVGIAAAIDHLRAQYSYEPKSVAAVMIGTTHFLNALIEARDLAPTAALRIGLPATSALPPFSGWPAVLVEAVRGHAYMAHGGYEIDGRHIAEFDPDEIRRHAVDMADRGLTSLAITSVFSPLNDEFERKAAAVVRTELGEDFPISLSHEIGRVGLLERENATIVNAALWKLAEGITSGLEKAVANAGIDAPVYMSQNDGTLMDIDHTRRYPVATFASGPTNSMRGAAALSGFADCIVVDIGGTTTDVGVLVNGFPRESSTEVQLAGLRTNFRMPDVLSTGIGGGSRIKDSGAVVGPDSVGYLLTTESVVFGGNTLTATDIAVMAGRTKVGDPRRVTVDHAVVERALTEIDTAVVDVIDRIRTSSEPLPVVAVGGGAILLPDQLDGLGPVHRPEHSGVANAIGAAIAQVSGEVERVVTTTEHTREAVLAEVRQEACSRAIAAGAKPNTVAIVDHEEIPVPYIPGNTMRVRVKAAGDLFLEEK